MPKAKPSAMLELWSINRWLRWTGVRLAIEVDIQGANSPTREPTRLGLVWWGWKDLFPRPQVSVGNFNPAKYGPDEDNDPLDAFKLNLDALKAALPPVDGPAEAHLERLLVEKRKHAEGDARKVREQWAATANGPAAHPSLKPASEHCQRPIKGEFGTWCRGCDACGTCSDDTDSW